MDGLCLIDGCLDTRNHNKKEHTVNFPMNKILKDLPSEVKKKLYKTVQTRGAQPYDRVPFQNRVARWNRVVIPYQFREHRSKDFENGYTVMVRPSDYFKEDLTINPDFDPELVIGKNAFIFYDNRSDWDSYPPLTSWTPSIMVKNGKKAVKYEPSVHFEGEYISRIPATTSQGEIGEKIVRGDPQGIRFFEYCSQKDSFLAAAQLAYLIWNTKDIKEYVVSKMPHHLELIINDFNLGDKDYLKRNRCLSQNNFVCCPLCLEELSISGFINRVKQTEGREVIDLTVTEINLFHLNDIKPGEYNHMFNKLGWGHFHCNTVARDIGIEETLNWMLKVLKRNKLI